ncbi:MAG: hypothetical protein Q3976_04940 [Corynebacterium sp.]|nr:hypothetical protein [Corynebacterium sp.]
MKNKSATTSPSRQQRTAFLDPIYRRVILLAIAGISLLLGLAAGSYLLGFRDNVVAEVAQHFANYHALFMVFGFIGGAITLERAVAIRNSWTWIAPALNVLAILTLLLGLPEIVPAALWLGSAVLLLGIYWLAWQRQPALAVVVQSLGAIAFGLAALQWGITTEFPVLLAAVFPIATILGERMELARIAYGPNSPRWITGEVVALLVAATIQASHAFGVLLIVVALHSGYFDAARKLIHGKGLARYSASCMLLGYGWLIIAGLLWGVAGEGTSYAYDAQIHCIFIGFVLSMIFAHAPTILGAVVGIQVPFNYWLVVPVAVVHIGLLIRVFAIVAEQTWEIGGLMNIFGVLLFMITALTLGIRTAHSRAKRRTA